MIFDAQDDTRLREEALDDAYFEHWRKVDDGSVHAIALVGEDNSAASADQSREPARRAYLLWSAHWTALAHAPPARQEVSAVQAPALFEFTFAHRENDQCEWRVHSSNIQDRIDSILQLPSAAALAALRAGDALTLPFDAAECRQWRVTQNSAANATDQHAD